MQQHVAQQVAFAQIPDVVKRVRISHRLLSMTHFGSFIVYNSISSGDRQ
jgi:hypothetical protein